MKKIRIFISSPGDVHQERQIAYKVITEISKQFSKYVTVEVLMWENFRHSCKYPWLIFVV